MIEIIVCRPLRGAQPGNASNGPDNKGASWSAENRKTSFGNSGHGKMMGYPSRLVAMGTLDVQTALSSCSGSGSEESGVCLSLGKIEVPGLESNGLRSKVILTFSSEAALAERVGGMQQHAEEDEVLPASFVVATTLFDCATEMKEAELRLYVRCGGTERDRPLLCSARRGAIGKLLFVGYMCESVVFTLGISPIVTASTIARPINAIAWRLILFGVAPSQYK